MSTMTTPALHTVQGDHGPELWATPKPPAGARLVSYSELQSMDCWLKHHYSYGLGLKPLQRYVALQLGSAWDAFYNTWHNGPSELPELPRYAPELPPVDAELLPAEVERALIDVLIEREQDGLQDLLHDALAAADHELRREAVKVMGELTDRGLPMPADWQQQLATLRTTVYGMGLHYAARWQDEPEVATLGVQVRFAVPLPSAKGGTSNKFYLHGVLDRLERRAAELWIVDAKLRMGTIEDDYRESYERDPQLALYGWALRQAGWNVVGGYIDAASASLPRWPQLKAQPETVYTDEVDADGKPVALQVPVLDDETGEPVVYKSGARKGEVKTKAAKRPALYSGWENLTTLPVALAAIEAHGLPPEQYALELEHLAHQWAGRLDSRYHWRMDRVPYTDAQLVRVSAGARGVAGYLDTLPPIPMPSKMKCKYCSFKELCPSTHPADFAEGYTTREQRKAASEKRRATEAAEAATDIPTEHMAAEADALESIH